MRTVLNILNFVCWQVPHSGLAVGDFMVSIVLISTTNTILWGITKLFSGALWQ